MATGTRTEVGAFGAGLRAYRLTVRQFLAMIDAGIFPPGSRVELLDGILATRKISRSTPYLADVPIYPLSVSQFEAMIRARIFPASARVELLAGVPVVQMTKNPPHNFTVHRLGDLLAALLAPDWIVRREMSVRLGRSWRPEPDLAVARGPDDRYRGSDPGATDLAALVEVADSSYPDPDRGLKWRGYAAARVPVYWVVNLGDRLIEVYTNPAGRGKAARYRDAATFGPGANVPVVVDGRERGRVVVNEILP
jgi:hypothetical protein